MKVEDYNPRPMTSEEIEEIRIKSYDFFKMEEGEVLTNEVLDRIETIVICPRFIKEL